MHPRDLASRGWGSKNARPASATHLVKLYTNFGYIVGPWPSPPVSKPLAHTSPGISVSVPHMGPGFACFRNSQVKWVLLANVSQVHVEDCCSASDISSNLTGLIWTVETDYFGKWSAESMLAESMLAALNPLLVFQTFKGLKEEWMCLYLYIIYINAYSYYIWESPP